MPENSFQQIPITHASGKSISLFGHFDVPKGPGENKLQPSRVVPKLCVFHPDMVQGCLAGSVCLSLLVSVTPDAAFMI